MKNETVRIEDKKELVGFIRSIGTECRFVTVHTETEVRMNKARNTGRKVPSPKTGKLINEKEPNPYYGTIKVATRNGFVNANFVKAVEKRYAEIMGIDQSEVEYTPGETNYVHCNTEDGKPLPLCENKNDKAAGIETRKYLQMFPLRNLGETTYFLNGQKLTKDQVKDMYDNWVTDDENPEWKPRVIILSMDSIRWITFRKVKLLNDTFSRIADMMSRWKNVSVSTQRPPRAVAAEV